MSTILILTGLAFGASMFSENHFLKDALGIIFIAVIAIKIWRW